MVNFTNPPINEVALGIVFDSRLDLLVPFFGEFWQNIKGQYPKTQHALPIVSQDGAPVVDAYGLWLPRVWFVSEDETRLIQLQQDRLIVNWRQTERLEEYVRFPAVKNDFDAAWTKFSTFVAEKLDVPLQPTRLELSYVNIIESNEEETVADICQRVLRDNFWSEGHGYLPKPSKLQTHLEFFISEEVGVLTIRISNGHKKSDGKLVLKLELVVASNTFGLITLDDWISRAHDVIISAFKDMTQVEIQIRDWGLQ